MHSGKFIYGHQRYACRKLSANTWENKYTGEEP